MPTEFVDTVRQTIYPGDCDAIGHLNTRHYTALFDHAGWELLRRFGINDHTGPGATTGWVDVETLVKYRREIVSGMVACVRSRLFHVGRTSLVTEHMITVDNADDERATSRMTSVRFDLVARRAVEVPVCLHPYREIIANQ